MHRDEFRQVVTASVKQSLAGQGFDSTVLSEQQLTQLTTAIADGVFAGLEELVDAPMTSVNPTLVTAAAAATAAATAAASIAQDPPGPAASTYPAGYGVTPVGNADLARTDAPAGLPVIDSPIAANVPTSDPRQELLIWRGRPYLTLGTIYELTSQRLRVIRGLVSNAIDEIELVRVQDTRVTQNAGERMFDVGDIAVISGDISNPDLVLYNVKNPVEVREAIRKAVYEERQRRNMLYREVMDSGGSHDDHEEPLS